MTLEKELERCGAFSEEQVLDIFKQLCEVLHYLHTFKPHPIIYRDMKPSNIIRMKEGTIKLIDFGIAREYKEEVAADTVYIGTRGYAAPEQYGNSQTSAATDIYSLGITMAHLLSGISPNQKEFEKIVSQMSHKDSTGLQKIISRCIPLNPGERYSCVQDLQKDLKLYETSKARSSNDFHMHTPRLGVKNPTSKATGFKRQVLSIWGNSEFASEVAYQASKFSDLKILLINLDFTTHGVANYLNLKPRQKSAFEFGFFDALLEAEEGKLTGELLESACCKRPDMENLYILMSHFDLNNYELYQERKIEKLIETAYRNFDLTLLVTGKSIFDSYTKKAFMQSDYIIAPLHAEIDPLQEYTAKAAHFSNIYNLSSEKFLYLAYEYKNKINLPLEAFIDKVGQESFLGKISYQPSRETYRNLKASFAKRLDLSGQNEYKDLLSRFQIVPKRTVKEKVMDWMMESKISTRKKGKVMMS